MRTGRVKFIMKKQGVTQQYVAYKLKLSQAAICQKINGQRSFKPSEIKNMSSLLGLTDSETIEIFLN